MDQVQGRDQPQNEVLKNPKPTVLNHRSVISTDIVTQLQNTASGQRGDTVWK